MTYIISQLSLPFLKSRRKQSHLILIYRCLTEEAAIPTTELKKPARINKHAHCHSFSQLQNRINVYRASYLPPTILDWNTLPIHAFDIGDIASEQVEGLPITSEVKFDGR